MKEELESLGFVESYTLMFRRDGVNFVSRLPNGKVCLRDRKEKVEPIEGIEYECKVKELEKVAFARIICEVFLPRIIMKDDELIIVTKDEDGNVKRETMKMIKKAIEKIDDEKIMIIKRKKNE